MVVSQILNIKINIVSLLIAMLTLLWMLPSEVQAALTVDQIKVKIADENTACQKSKENIIGIHQLDKKMPGILRRDRVEVISLLTENTSTLPEQDALPTADEIRAAIASIRIDIACDDRIKEILRPFSTPTMLTYMESMNYLKVAQRLKLLTDGIPYRAINKSSVELYQSSMTGIVEIMKQLKLGTRESVAEADKIARNAEKQLLSFLEQYDLDVKSKKKYGYNKCDRIGPFEVCTK